MKPVRLGIGRHMWPVPWFVFRRAAEMTARKTARRLADLDDVERRVHRYVVTELPRFGRPMPPEHVAEGLGMPLAEVEAVLGALERRLIFLYRPDGRDVVWAYPVTVERTPYPLTFSTGERLYAA